jgi:hypothetical protein
LPIDTIERLAVDDWKDISASNPDIDELMRKIGVDLSWLSAGGFTVTSPFEIANRQAVEPVYDIRLLSKAGGPVRTSVGFEVRTEPFSAVSYDPLVVGVSKEDASADKIEFIR